MMPVFLRQILAVLRLELKKTFFARRGLWVYLVAFAPGVLYLAHDMVYPAQVQRLRMIASNNPLPIGRLGNIVAGMNRDTVHKALGPPYNNPRGPFMADRYTDGSIDARIYYRDGVVTDIVRDGPPTIAGQTNAFATLFQNVYLRLGIFFGCIGIFANLFRGEMLDKSLHYYLLTPMRREIFVAGKFLAGLVSISVIFGLGAALQFAAMLGQFDRSVAINFLHSGGSQMAWSYLGVTLVACVAYGSVFIALGLLFRNPIVPAAFVLMWESILLFMPTSLKEMSVIYYLESICPVPGQIDNSMPAILKLLIANDATPVSKPFALTMIAIISLVCLGIAAFRGRRLEINYGVE